MHKARCDSEPYVVKLFSIILPIGGVVLWGEDDDGWGIWVVWVISAVNIIAQHVCKGDGGDEYYK